MAINVGVPTSGGSTPIIDGGGHGGGNPVGVQHCNGGEYCSNPAAINFNELQNIITEGSNTCIDNSLCQFATVDEVGEVDVTVGYNPEAQGYCQDPAALNFHEVGECQFVELTPNLDTDEVFDGEVDGEGADVSTELDEPTPPTGEPATAQNNVCGCMDSTATNYNPEATYSHEGEYLQPCGECVYPEPEPEPEPIETETWFEENKMLVLGGAGLLLIALVMLRK